MPFFFLYLLKLSISLGGVWLFYQWLLRKLTFYNWNRCYLIAYSLFCFFIPFINISPIVDPGPAGKPSVVSYIPGIVEYASPVRAFSPDQRPNPAVWDTWTLLAAVLASGVLVLLIRLGVRWVSILNIGRKARLIRRNGLKIYEVGQPIIPFSFRDAIYINPCLHTEKEYEGIILHEYVHVRQRHTLDILFSELLCALNWYNPFAWLIRHSIRQNLEFIADKQVLEKGLDKKGYQYHLLKVVGQEQYGLATNFNFSSLKKRIVMMNKIRSARMHLVKFLFILPVLAILLVAFRDKYEGMLKYRDAMVFVNHAGLVLDISNRKPLAGVTVLEKNLGLRAITDERGFYKLRFPVKNDSIRVHLDFIRAGYESGLSEYYMPSVKESMGRIDVCVLIGLPHTSPHVYIGFPFMKPCPVDPGYEDVLKAAQENERLNADIMTSMKMRTDHPEVSLFYTFEDHSKQIVIYTDGHVEKYGYPGSPSIADMEKKFGTLPDMIKAPDPAAGKGYMARWENISAEAEKQFHTGNPDVRTILFPGDSRVIAIPFSGKPQVYDMDNADPKERPAFEKLYGKLPNAVPEAGNSGNWKPADKDRLNSGKAPADTTVLPAGGKTGTPPLALSSADTFVSHADLRPPDKQDPLIVLDGKELPKDGLSKINPNMIASINVLKGQSAVDKYGEKGKYGVIEITSKEYFLKTHPGEKLPGETEREKRRPDSAAAAENLPTTMILTNGIWTATRRTDGAGTTLMQALPKKFSGLMYLDGKEISPGEAAKLNPATIGSMQVFTGEDAIKKYGEKGKDGVILITSKK